jgi:heterodisulfide reductase subunit A-like polyferredoxin
VKGQKLQRGWYKKFFKLPGKVAGIQQHKEFVMASAKNANAVGSVMVVGAGIAGMQSALDLANSGYFVYLVEKSSAIGGLMSRLDKTFPTNDCAM